MLDELCSEFAIVQVARPEEVRRSHTEFFGERRVDEEELPVGGSDGDPVSGRLEAQPVEIELAGTGCLFGGASDPGRDERRPVRFR